MWRNMCDFWKIVICENGVPSLTRLISIFAFVAFLGASFYLMVKGQHWDHYDTFAFITGGGGTGAQVFNKYINSKYNSRPGEYMVKQAGEGSPADRDNKRP